MNDIFRFKKFSVKQNSNVFKVGTDGVLAGCLANISQAKSILDIGTGTGLLSLLCAQRNPQAHITAIDSEEEAYNLAKENFINSSFTNISAIHSELQKFSSPYKFDYILCNPPYFKISEQLHHKHPIARHQLKLDYKSLLEKSNELISKTGYIGYIFPSDQEGFIISQASLLHLYPKKIIHISGIKNGKVKRVFLELSCEKTKAEISDFYIEKSPRIRSEEYEILTKDFYL